MNRQAQAVVLFLVGGAMVHAGTTDLYLRYVKAGLQPMVVGAGAVLIVAALTTVWYERKHARTGPADTGVHGAEGEAHAHREPRVSWLLVLPLFALILVAPPALGSYSALRTGTALQAPLAYPPLPSGDPVRLSLVDYAGRAAYDHGRSLGDRRIAITGFVALDGKGTPYLVRMALNCCAADAQPVKVGLTGRIPPVLQPDTWLELTGTYTGRLTRDPVNNGVIPFFDIAEARPVPTPRDPYDESWNN
ncbi:TIGR03943 family putative permease subunit [Streptomyces sp. WI04-05B]|uniref:TIGR03943 family putative permease subunit n=1 Tax=Streptomyces TaxID=1883 RepID=UPI0029AC4F99|nr:MULTISPECIES: TIGR03943 family protein [unclassified Streptomyces]MDX2548511.1 TIGR03943 family protein [Streptomyces sp. WI04-05B]MDX2582629.1 TIGR03943 family protein [Streptomyces sp. WI04-05A]